MEGLPPLLWSMVDCVEKGEFVEFTEFPVFDGTRKPGEWGLERVSPTDKGGSPSKNSKRKGPREVPDVFWWGTCFSLYERVRVQSKPEVAEALCAYQEAIVGMARKHPWDCVARYNRAFRMKAPGNSDVAWSKVDTALLVNEITTWTWIREKSRVYPSGNVPRRERKATVGVCRLFNAEGHCGYGQSCKFRHICFAVIRPQCVGAQTSPNKVDQLRVTDGSSGSSGGEETVLDTFGTTVWDSGFVIPPVNVCSFLLYCVHNKKNVKKINIKKRERKGRG